MGDVLCEKHGLICSMKTGSSEGSSNFGKTFFLCPLYPKECSFMQPSSIPPQFCKCHSKNMIDLKVFKKLPTGETMEYSRCKESKNTSRKFCDRQIIKNKPELVSDSSKMSKETILKSSVDKDKEVCKSTNRPEDEPNSSQPRSKEISETVPSEHHLRQNPITSNINSSFREPVLIHSSSSDEDSDTDEDKKISKRHMEINQKQAKHKVADVSFKKTLGINTQQEKNYLKQVLDKKKKVYKTADVSKLPDKGARLKTEIDNLETALNELQLVEDNHATSCSREYAEDDAKLSKNKGTETTVEDKNENVIKSTSLQRSQVKFSPPFTHLPKSFETFRDLKAKNDKEQSATTKEAAVGNKTILIDPLPQSSASFEKYRSSTERNGGFLKSTNQGKKISDAMIELQKSLNLIPGDTQEEEDPAALTTSLFQHQRKALAWLLWRESHFPYGGILADDMGLGKSLTMVSLILKHKENIQNNAYSTAKTNDRETLIPQVGPTLVICPASLIHHWENEILKRCKVQSVETYVYHGPNRIKDPEMLRKYDVVITTYETVRTDMEPELKYSKEKTDSFKNSKQRSSLVSVPWERIILDEAHKVKNPSSLVSQSIYLLPSKYRWAITGTPIHNNLMDLHSLIKFLRFSPFDDLILWKKYIIGKGEKSLMKTLVKFLLLRRTKDQTDKKGKHLVQLPPKEIHIVKLKLTKKERNIYDKLHNFCRSRMNSFLEDKESKSILPQENVKRSYGTNTKIDASFLLVMLLRLQQCCCHLALLQKVIEEEVSLSKDNEEKDLAEELSSLSLNNSSNISSPELISPSTTAKSSLPILCSTPKDNSLNFESLGLSSYVDDADFKAKANSTKVSSILEELMKIQRNAKDGRMEKCVLVSQWVSFLEIMAVHIKSKGFRFKMISGNIKAEERMGIVDDFNQPNGIEILLLSLKAGGVGLNLVGGNHLFLLDTHWNPALENQACDRIYRIGQTKNVFIHKFVCMDTIEENIVKLQEEKLSLARNVLEGENSKHFFTLQDMQELLNF